MRINGEIDTPFFKTVNEIDYGECFIYRGDDTLYMKIDNDLIVEVANGEVSNPDYQREVMEIETELNIITRKQEQEGISNKTSTIVRLDDMCRINIPKNFRELLKIEEESYLKISFDETAGYIIIENANR